MRTKTAIVIHRTSNLIEAGTRETNVLLSLQETIHEWWSNNLSFDRLSSNRISANDSNGESDNRTMDWTHSLAAHSSVSCQCVWQNCEIDWHLRTTSSRATRWRSGKQKTKDIKVERQLWFSLFACTSRVIWHTDTDLEQRLARQSVFANMQSVFNSVKGTALGVAEYLTPVLKVSNF